ncbi:hypothetical protein [Methanocella conradii]|uniref:hypothetical protein n=1 Tax=Methanocella conradii TaxID=1175444 RepID=UPI0024B327D9|nr:hypothetical protein [Methanocella conradii]MDI6896878.1 hypothetical protein [Methanocella conradii]
MLESTNKTKKILMYVIPDHIREELGEDGRIIDRIKVVSFQDKDNTRGVYLCTTGNDEIEEVSPTPMQACGLVTVLDGKFVLIHSDGETTLHFTNAKSEDEVIDEVYLLSEKSGLAKGIAAYKKMMPRLDHARAN